MIFQKRSIKVVGKIVGEFEVDLHQGVWYCASSLLEWGDWPHVIFPLSVLSQRGKYSVLSAVLFV